MASFRESSELEYGADDAFILAPNGDTEYERDSSPKMVLKHLKSRYGETKNIALIFHKKHQRFTEAEPSEPDSTSSKEKLIQHLNESSKSSRKPILRKGGS